MDSGKIIPNSLANVALSRASRPEAGPSMQPLLPTEAVSPVSDSPKTVESAVSDLKSIVQKVQRNLDFSVDESSGDVVVKVIDSESGKIVRQIPSEELLRLSERLEDMRSLMLGTKA